MEGVATGGSASLAEFGGALRRRWWMLALGAIIGLAVASSYLLVAPKTYESSALVRVAPIGMSDPVVDGARTISGINMDTEAQLMRSQAVSSRAKEQLETPEPVSQLVQKVQVSVPLNTNVLKVTFSDADPEGAAAGAQAYADQYLANRQASATASAKAQESEYRRLIRQLETEAQGQSGVERETTLQEITSVSALLNTVVGATFAPGEVINLALVPRRPASPNELVILFSGFVLGVLFGLLGVAYLERRDGRVHNWRILERRLGRRVLVSVPGNRDEAPTLFPAHSPGGQAFTQLRGIVMSGMPDGGILLVAEPENGSGADMVAANLGAAFARADQRTTVVVADVTSSVPAILGAPHGPGLSELLRNKASVNDVRRQIVAVAGLSVVAPGLHLDSEIDDLEGAGIGDVLSSVAERSPVVIVRAPATTAGANAQLLARLADAALPVVAIGSTHRSTIEETLRQWSIMGIEIPGVVAVPPFGPGPDPIVVSPKKSERTGERLSRAAAAR